MMTAISANFLPEVSGMSANITAKLVKFVAPAALLVALNSLEGPSGTRILRLRE